MKSEIIGVDAEIAGVARVIGKKIADTPIDKDKDSNDTSYEYNGEISNDKEYNNDKISSEDVYHPNVHSNSTTPSQKKVYKIRGGNWDCDRSHHFGHEAQFIEYAFNTYGFKTGLKEFKHRGEELLYDEFLNVHK